MDFVQFDEILKKAKRFGGSIGLNVLVPESASDLEGVLNRFGLFKFSSLPDNYGNWQSRFRHRDYADYLEAIRGVEHPETVGNKFPLCDVEVVLVSPNRDAQGDNPANSILSDLERTIEEKATKPVLDLSSNISLLIYQIPLKFSLIRKSAKLRGTKTYPIYRFVDNIKYMINIAISLAWIWKGSNPEHNFGRYLIANMQSANVSFYAFGHWDRDCILLCENSPSNGGLITYQKDVPFIYRGLIQKQTTQH